MAEKEKTIVEAVKAIKEEISAKAKKRSNSHCCDISYEGEGEIKNLRIEVAKNGFTVGANYGSEPVLTKTPEEAAEAVKEFLS